MGSPGQGRNVLNVRGSVRIHGRVQAEDNVVELGRDREAPAGPPSFEELFLDVHDRLYRALYFVTGSSADAEELMQDAFLKLWERWDRLDTIEDPVAYLFRVALNGVRMRARRARGGREEDRTDRGQPETRSMTSTSGRTCVGCCDGISPRQRTAIVLTEIFGYSSEQAAGIMGIQPTTVRVLASQGRAALRES